MAVPLQYQSQFIPTNFGQINNVLGMYRQDMNRREQQFDQAAQLQNEALSYYGQLPTSDVSTRNELVEGLQSRIEEAVNKRGGDYGAASKDIAKIISKERSNPWYEFDRSKLAKSQEYNQLRNRLGVNFYATGDPNQVTLEQYMADPNALNFRSYDVGQIKDIAQQKAKEYATANKQFINRGVGNMMREIGWQLGMGDEQKAQQYLQQNPEFIDDILSAHGIDDPNVRAMAEQAALSGLVGKRDTRFTPDYEQRYAMEARYKRLQSDPSTRGVYGQNVPLVKEGRFKKAGDIKKAVTDDKNTFTKNVGSEVLSKAVTPEFVSNLDFTPKELQRFENFGGNIYEFLDTLKEEKSTSTKEAGPTPSSYPTTAFPGTTIQQTTKEDRQDKRRLFEIEDKIDNAVDLQLTAENNDFTMPITQVDPWNTKALSALKSATANKTIGDFDILSGDIATLDEGELEDNEDYQSLAENFEVLGGTHDVDKGVVLYLKDSNTGKGYLAKAKSPGTTSQLAGIIDEDLAKLDFSSNINFSGNLMEMPDDTTVKLPFEVESDDVRTPQGQRKVFKIKGLSNAEYWRPFFELERAKLEAQGYEEEVIEESLSSFAPLLTDDPYKTPLKQDIVDYLNVLQELNNVKQ